MFEEEIFSKIGDNQKINRIKIAELLIYLGTGSYLILDAGCGRGWMSFILKEHGKNKVVATDLSLIQLQRAKKLFVDNKNTIPLINSNLESLPFKDGIFDFIICCDVLEHTKSPYSVLNEFYRVLKKEAFLLLTLPGPLYSLVYDKMLFWLWKNRQIKHKIIMPLSIGNAQYHQQFFLPNKLTNLIKKSGFQIKNFYNLSFLGYFITTVENLFGNKKLKSLFNALIEIDSKLSRFLPLSLGSSWILVCSRI